MSKFSEKLDQFLDQIKEQEWFQQIQTAYLELPEDQQKVVKWGGWGASFALLFYFSYGFVKESAQIKSEYYEKQELVSLLTQAADELSRLRGQSRAMSAPGSEGAFSWKSTLESILALNSIPASNLELLSEKKSSAGAAKKGVEVTETDLEFKISGLTSRNIVPVLYQLEHSIPPIKLSKLNIQHANVETGGQSLNLLIQAKGFQPKSEKKP